MRVLAGILLIIVSFVSLFGVMVIPVLPPTQDDVNINNYLTTLLCQPGEKLVRDLYHRSDSRGTSYSMTPYCVNSERQRQDVSGRWVLIGMGGFLLPFFVGLALLISVGTRAARIRRQAIHDNIQSFQTNMGFSVIDARGSSGRQIEFHDGVLKVNGVELKTDALTPEKLDAFKAQLRGSSDACILEIR